MIRTHGTLKKAELARTKDGRRILVAMELPTDIDLEELWELMDATSCEVTMQTRQLPFRAIAQEPTPAEAEAELEAEPTPTEGWYFRLLCESAEPVEYGPYATEEEAQAAIEIEKGQSATDGLSRIIEGPYMQEPEAVAEEWFYDEITPLPDDPPQVESFGPFATQQQAQEHMEARRLHLAEIGESPDTREYEGPYQLSAEPDGEPEIADLPESTEEPADPALYTEAPESTVLTEHPEGEFRRQTIAEMIDEMDAATDQPPADAAENGEPAPAVSRRKRGG